MFPNMASLHRHAALMSIQARMSLVPVTSNAIRLVTSKTGDESLESSDGSKTKLSKKGKNIAQKMEKFAKGRNLYGKYFNAKETKKKSPVFEVHEEMSVVELARVMKVDKNLLLEVILDIVS